VKIRLSRRADAEVLEIHSWYDAHVFATEVVVFGVIHGARDARSWKTRGEA